MVDPVHVRRFKRGVGGPRGLLCRECGRLMFARASIDTGVCGLCVDMTVLQPRDIADLSALGVLV